MNTEKIHQLREPENELHMLIQHLVEKFKPMRIYSFHKIRKTEQRSGCFTSGMDYIHDHHFLLMIMESSTRNEHEVQDFCRTKFNVGKITILSHGIETINESIVKKNRFFTHILKHGQLLYNQSGLLNFVSEMTRDIDQDHIKAKKHFTHRIKLAQGFLYTAGECYHGEHLELSIFLLHQTVEQLTIGLLRVNLGYRSDIHHLGRQLDLCSCFLPEASDMFRTTSEDNRLFDILLKSYSQVRYKDGYEVDFDDAGRLKAKVEDLFKLTRHVCEQKISELENNLLLGMESEVSVE